MHFENRLKNGEQDPILNELVKTFQLKICSYRKITTIRNDQGR